MLAQTCVFEQPNGFVLPQMTHFAALSQTSGPTEPQVKHVQTIFPRPFHMCDFLTVFWQQNVNGLFVHGAYIQLYFQETKMDTIF